MVISGHQISIKTARQIMSRNKILFPENQIPTPVMTIKINPIRKYVRMILIYTFSVIFVFCQPNISLLCGRLQIL